MSQRLDIFFEKCTQDETRVLLRKFYEGLYKHDMYHPDNSLQLWRKIKAVGSGEFTLGLEIGCGTGRAIGECVSWGWDVYGFDVALTAFKYWQKYEVADRCLCADAVAMPYKDNTFDFILCADVLEHVPEWDIPEVLNEAYRVCDGKAMLVPCLEPERQMIANRIQTHITVKSTDWWREQVKNAGFNILNEFPAEEHHITFLCETEVL